MTTIFALLNIPRMNNKNEYQRKLGNPLWQKKKLEIMQRDEFKCKHCGSDQKELQVHHLQYIQGREPWDYTNDCLLTLCHECHWAEEAQLKGMGQYILSVFRRCNADTPEMMIFLSYIINAHNSGMSLLDMGLDLSFISSLGKEHRKEYSDLLSRSVCGDDYVNIETPKEPK